MNNPLAMWEPKKAALEEAAMRLISATSVTILTNGRDYLVSGGVLPAVTYTQRTDNESDAQPEHRE